MASGRRPSGGRRRHWTRYRTVVTILTRHGFRYVVQAAGMAHLLPAWLRLQPGRPDPPDPSWPDHLVAALVDLGPTFVKLGQLAQTRADLLPESLVRALERLQDDVPPFAFDVVQRTLEAAWGRPLADTLDLDVQPLAAASLGQVHGATLPDGTRVVVKVRRPGVLEETAADFEILADLARMVERRTEWGRQYGIRDVTNELVRTMREELDFTIEAQHTDAARHYAALTPGVLVPEVVWSLTRPDVLVLSRLPGFKIESAAGIMARGLDPEVIAARLVEVMCRQVFLDGFFHADPHPGNIHLTACGDLVLLDWGLVGHLPRTLREQSVDLLLGMLAGRSELIVDTLTRLGAADGAVDRTGLIRDVDRLRRQYSEVDLHQFQLGEALTALLTVANRHRLRLPPEYALLARMAVTLDGLVRRLSPSASLAQYGRPLIPDLVYSRVNPGRLGEQALHLAMEWGRVADELPLFIERLMRQVDGGQVRVLLEPQNIERVLAHSEKLVNRLGLSLLLSALVVGGALVVHRDELDRMMGWPFGEYVFLAAAAMGLWLVATAIRRGRL